MEGRPIADTRQGNVRLAVVRAAQAGGFGEPVRADSDGLGCLRRTNPKGAVLELCLHPGGHSIKSKWLERAWREFEKIGAL
jgi:polyhydroxybutyrate depolymerase